MKPIELIKKNLIATQRVVLGIANRLFMQVESVKISIKTSALEQEMNKDFALLGEHRFQGHDKDPSLFVKDPAILKLTSKILVDQNRLADMKSRYLKDRISL
jgi:hypothetical protein